MVSHSAQQNLADGIPPNSMKYSRSQPHSAACWPKRTIRLPSIGCESSAKSLNHTAPEVELAFVRIAPATYLADFGTADQAKRKVQETILLDWRAASGIAAGLGEIAALPDSVTNKAELAAAAQKLLRAMLDYRNSGLNDKHAGRSSF